MFKNTFQSGFLSILYSIGSKPLQIWDKKVRNGHIKRITDNDIQSLVLEVEGTNVSTTYITCPADPKKTLGIKLPFLVMIIKNLKKYFTFEVQVLDDKNVRRRFRASNYQSTTRVKPFICTMPMRLDDGWNQIQFNLSDFTRRAYGTNYIETLRVQIHANCRIRRVYFSDRLYSEDELPAEFKLYLPVQNKAKVRCSCTDFFLFYGLYCSVLILCIFSTAVTADWIPSFPLSVLSAHVHTGWISSGTIFVVFQVLFWNCDWFPSAE
uniref:Cilia- and flagella-associated protein 20 n=1 Tax=Sinocyclocheilus anshuiensis TaxID=1608454 RepID=A0A671KJY8_9TELE